MNAVLAHLADEESEFKPGIDLQSWWKKKQGRLLIKGSERELIRADDLVREHLQNKTDITKQRTTY